MKLSNLWYTIVLFICSFCHLNAQNHGQNEMRTINTILPFTTESQEVTVEIINGWAIYHGDIILGTADDLAQRGAPSSNATLWNNSTIPYTIGGGFNSSQLNAINSGIATLSAQTNLCLVPRTNETDYVAITFDAAISGGSSYVGKIGGGQELHLGGNINASTVMHEFCHAAGIWHEQSRPDRDNYVIINLGNILTGQSFNFDLEPCTAYGAYDYNSIMHYESYAFSSNGLPTITKINGSLIGYNTVLTATDIGSVNFLYPTDCSNLCPTTRNLTTAVLNGDYEASSTITASNTLSSGQSVEYDAASSITLQPGFWAQNGTDFHAVIEGCGGVYMPPPPNNNGNTDFHANQSSIKTDGSINTTADTRQIFPNPIAANQTLLLNFGQPIKTVQLLDITGKQIYYQQLEADTYQHALQSPAISGIYLLQIITEQGNSTQKIVVQ